MPAGGRQGTASRCSVSTASTQPGDPRDHGRDDPGPAQYHDDHRRSDLFREPAHADRDHVLVLYGAFVLVQTVRHRDYFLPAGEAAHDAEAHAAAPARAWPR